MNRKKLIRKSLEQGRSKQAGKQATLSSGTDYIVRYWRMLVRPALGRVSICLQEIFRSE
jgi:hypothetical protein